MKEIQKFGTVQQTVRKQQIDIQGHETALASNEENKFFFFLSFRCNSLICNCTRWHSASSTNDVLNNSFSFTMTNNEQLIISSGINRYR